MACYRNGENVISCTFKPHNERRIHSMRKISYGEPLSIDRPASPQKIAILIPLDHLRQLMREFCDEASDGSDEDEHDSLRRLYLSNFLAWLRKRQEKVNASDNKSI